MLKVPFTVSWHCLTEFSKKLLYILYYLLTMFMLAQVPCKGIFVKMCTVSYCVSTKKVTFDTVSYNLHLIGT